jgi:hypothetical protein
MSPLHVNPIRKVKIRRIHFNVVLLLFSSGVLCAHYYFPQHEAHVGFATNLLFLMNPED